MVNFSTSMRGLALTGSGAPFDRGTYWQPPEGGYAEDVDELTVEDWDELEEHLADAYGVRRRDVRRSRGRDELVPRLRAWILANWYDDLLDALSEDGPEEVAP